MTLTLSPAPRKKMVDKTFGDIWWPIGSMYGMFTYIYLKHQPSMYVSIPVPWIPLGSDIGYEICWLIVGIVVERDLY